MPEFDESYDPKATDTDRNPAQITLNQAIEIVRTYWKSDATKKYHDEIMDSARYRDKRIWYLSLIGSPDKIISD